MFIAPMHLYVTNVFVYNLHITIFSGVYSNVTLMYSYVTRMFLVCAYATRMYSCGVLVTIIESLTNKVNDPIAK